jgi:hypothetical protein
LLLYFFLKLSPICCYHSMRRIMCQETSLANIHLVYCRINKMF